MVVGSDDLTVNRGGMAVCCGKSSARGTGGTAKVVGMGMGRLTGIAIITGPI